MRQNTKTKNTVQIKNLIISLDSCVSQGVYIIQYVTIDILEALRNIIMYLIYVIIYYVMRTHES